MIDWLRRVLKLEPRGTLTLLSGGEVILGTPSGTTDALRYRATVEVEEWRTSISSQRQTLTFPWPMDVDDRRTPPRARR